jgi:GH15 family glucan-1,4-alpha-glucosidase
MMAVHVADYAMIGDRSTGALVDRTGTIAWWCAPRVDSGAVFAALLGDERNGFWRISPNCEARSSRAYRPQTLVLETTFDTAGGRARVIDLMSQGDDVPTIVRIVEGLTGCVEFSMQLNPRMHYGRLVPVSRATEREWFATSGPDALCLRGDAVVTDEGGSCSARFRVVAGRRVRWVLQWFPGHEAAPPEARADHVLEATLRWWERWSAGIRYDGPYHEMVVRSAITLKALTNRHTGAIVAALTTSLPERGGGNKNWDYRYCWLRDASFTAASLLRLGLTEEAAAFRDWFMRVYAGDPANLHIMYGVGGERLTPEYTLPWLDGFQRSKPVRVGNGAHDQFQLGIFGDVMSTFGLAARGGMRFDERDWALLSALVPYLESVWQRPGNGIWELRREQRQYVDSKVMAWVAARELGSLATALERHAEAQRAERLATSIRAEIERDGYDPERGVFTQYYGSRELDASLLLLPIVGFLSADDSRVRATCAAIDRELNRSGFVFRYSADFGSCAEGRVETEGSFTMCGFWLVQALVRSGHVNAATEQFERMLATANDVGLLSEEYDVETNEPVGNVPQAFSHCGLIDAAVCLQQAAQPASAAPF